jgi:hypothetical protein
MRLFSFAHPHFRKISEMRAVLQPCNMAGVLEKNTASQETRR